MEKVYFCHLIKGEILYKMFTFQVIEFRNKRVKNDLFLSYQRFSIIEFFNYNINDTIYYIYDPFRSLKIRNWLNIRLSVSIRTNFR